MLKTTNSYIRVAFILFLGFASGLPLALTGQSMQAWLTVEGINIATIGFFSLVGLPYTFKFIWAPLMDRFELPFFGRRKGWLFITQISLAVVLFIMAQVKPSEATETFALIAVLVAFLSASQDIVIDAYRTDVLDPKERGLGASMSVLGYRLAMILSGGIAFTWADPKGNNWSWPEIYIIMAKILVIAAVISLFLLPKVPLEASLRNEKKTNAKNDLLGFFSLVLAVVIGYQFTTRLANPLMESLLTYVFPDSAEGVVNPDRKKWVDLAATYLGMLVTIPLGWWSIQKAKFETLTISLKNYFSLKSAMGFLILIVLYKVGDAFAGALTTSFLLKGVMFSQAEVGVANKVLGIWLTIFGAIVGGLIMIRIGLYRALLIFGILQIASNFGFWQLAVSGKDVWGSVTLPAYDIVISTLKEPTQIDYLLLFAVAVENITGGMGTAALVALLTSLCNQKFSATQYALLSSLAAVGRIWVGPMAGVLTASIGWPSFFLFSVAAGIPGIVMLVYMRGAVQELEGPTKVSLADD
jgi:PAT family beta-lactamase induction signal transducer AmpG